MGEATVRTFIAIGLPAPVRQELRLRQERLEAAQARYAKWVDPESIHLTLKFLGNVEQEMLPRLAEALAPAVTKIAAFELGTGPLGAFPGGRNVRVIWVGLKGNLDALERLHRAVEGALEPLGFPPEGRPFAPHLTLARLRETATREDKAQLASALAQSPAGDTVALPVSDILVMKSELGRSGSRYIVLYSVALGHPA